MNMDTTGEQMVVIVGAGLAGGNAAVTLREEGWRGRVVLLGAEPGIPFGRPPLCVYQLRTVAECDAIRQVAKPGARAVVVGMSFISSEVAASLRQMGLEGTAVLPGAAPLATVLGNEVAAVLAAIH